VEESAKTSLKVRRVRVNPQVDEEGRKVLGGVTLLANLMAIKREEGKGNETETDAQAGDLVQKRGSGSSRQEEISRLKARSGATPLVSDKGGTCKGG